MKGTRHNGRSGKNGVYNPLHNDRRFNPEHSEHIDNERVRQNIYWDCYQGYTTMEDQGKENNFSFEQIELAFYEEHYGNYVMKQNERHVKARHPDRCKEVEDVWKNKKTCPEESIYQLGTIDEHASVETLILVFDEFKKEFDKRFGSNVHIIDWSLHMDEATPHIHERHVFDATNRYGEIEPKQETALEELGFELPDPEKKRSKTNNRKVVFDSACRTMFLDICKRHGLELDEEPSYGGRKYLEKQDYMIDVETPYTIKYVFFGAEETGMHGSKEYVNSLTKKEKDNIVLMINIDSILAGDNLYLYGGRINDKGVVKDVEAVNKAFEIAKKANLPMQLTPKGNVDYPYPTGQKRSDHAPFSDIGIPYIYFEANNWLNGLPVETENHGLIMHSDKDDLSFIENEYGNRAKDTMANYSHLLHLVLQENNWE